MLIFLDYLQNIFESIISKIPPPEVENQNGNFKALIFDSYFDQYRGVVIYVRVMNGFVRKNMLAKFFKYDKTHEILEVGILQIERIPVDILEAGDVGYVIVNVKDVSNIKVGDTLTTKENECTKPLEGYKPIKSLLVLT